MHKDGILNVLFNNKKSRTTKMLKLLHPKWFCIHSDQ